MSKLNRNERGATLGLVVVLALVLVIVAVGLFQVWLLLGGSGELRNAVDAGALNLGKEVCNDPSAKISLQSGPEQQFSDVLDRSGHVGLLNINRVIGQAMLINANVQAMTGGYSSGNAASHAADAATAAQAICDRLTASLKNTAVTQPFFNNYIAANSVRMLGKDATVTSATSGWATACTDRGEESNLSVDAQQMPAGLNSGDTNAVTESGGNTVNFFKGYHAISANGRTFAFVPFKYAEKPHLISGFFFTQGQLPLPDWSSPVPNSFQATGITSKQQLGANTASAYVVANPQRQYQLAIPHAYVRIRLDSNDVHYSVNFEPDHNSTYDSFPGQTNVEVVIHPVGSGTLHGNSELGNEYLPPTLWQAINALGNHQDVQAVLLQRVQEIKHDFSQSDLQTLLSSTPLVPGTHDYIIFPTYTTSDNLDPTIMCQPSSTAQAAATWLNLGTDGDGTQQQIASENGVSPNTATDYLTGSGCTPGPIIITESGELKWTPGSGYDQCLGTLEIHRTTSIRYTGACTVI